jgi:signal transduction histidine kinase
LFRSGLPSFKSSGLGGLETAPDLFEDRRVKKPHRKLFNVLLPLLFLILTPLNAWAFVPHEYPAIYVHMLSLVFCFVALIIVLWAFIRKGLYKERRWKYLFLAAVFHAIWNADVIIGRIAEALWMDKARITGNTGGWQYFARQITIEGAEYFYYAGRLDFILLNIAMLFFYIWLREHLQKVPEERQVSTAAILPLFPILLTEIAGNVVFIALSTMCLVTSVKLYKKDRGNVLWRYMIGLSSTYFLFSISRSFGHILQHILIPTGDRAVWDSLHLDAIGGSLNTFSRFLVATLTIFFIWIYKIYIEISEDKKQLQTNVAERTGLIEQLEKDKVELRELDRLKSAFLANVSHELKTPMISIVGYTDLLLDRVDGPINEEQEKSLKKVALHSGHLLQLINSLLDISKMESGELKLAVRELDLKSLIEAVTMNFDPLIKQKGLTLNIYIDKNLPLIYGDEDKIKQILTNLLSNAVKFTHKGGITISANTSSININSGETPAFAEVCIEDTGIGIKEQDLGNIFDKFVQVDPTLSRQYEGAGLGLSITKGYVELHKGKLRVTSRYGEGSIFCFTLPLKKEILENPILIN